MNEFEEDLNLKRRHRSNYNTAPTYALIKDSLQFIVFSFVFYVLLLCYYVDMDLPR